MRNVLYGSSPIMINVFQLIKSSITVNFHMYNIKELVFILTAVYKKCTNVWHILNEGSWLVNSNHSHIIIHAPIAKQISSQHSRNVSSIGTHLWITLVESY